VGEEQQGPLVILVNIKLKQNKRKKIIYASVWAKQTLNEHWTIWKFNHKEKIKVFRFLTFQVIFFTCFPIVFNLWVLDGGIIPPQGKS
jgi:hypothetical protein